jgi:hypothetical protein
MLLILPFLLFSAVHALFEFPSDGCVAPAALDSCMTKTTQRAATCFSQQCPGVDPDCIKDGSCSSQNLKCLYTCLCTQAQESINCALSSCWNKASHKLMPHLAFKMRAALQRSNLIPQRLRSTHANSKYSLLERTKAAHMPRNYRSGRGVPVT